LRKIRRKSATVIAVAIALAGAGSGVTYAAAEQWNILGHHRVGEQPNGSYLTSTGQYLTPAGTMITQSGRPMALAVHPDGKTAATLTANGNGIVTIDDLTTHKVLQQFQPPAGVGSGNVSNGGLLYSKDGKYLWAAQTTDLLRLDVAADGTVSNPVVVALPGANGKNAVPAGLAWAPNGNLLVTLSTNNTLGVIDTATNTVVKQIPVGNVPNSVAVVDGHAYVSNQGGRPAAATDFTNNSYGTKVVADKIDGRAATGTVSDVDLATGEQVNTFAVGLQPTALLARGTDLLVTNSNDDTVSVIDTAKHRVGQTFDVNPLQALAYGSSPNALVMIDDTHLGVSLGQDNAIAVYDYRNAYTQPQFQGLIPTGWFPAGLVQDQSLHRLVVASEQGIGARGPAMTVDQGVGTKPAAGYDVYSDVGTVNLVATPTPQQIEHFTQQVFTNNQWNGLNRRNQPGKGKAGPVAIPAHVGDPSTIKHVFLIIKENRTYDQVLGDDPRGNGDPKLAQFGGPVTPNTHALSKEFPLIDNLYSDGSISSDGHNWLTQAFVNNYMEQQYGNWTRSYPSAGGDALAYAKSGFIWDNAMRHGVSITDWGEYEKFFGRGGTDNSPQGTWQQWYQDSQILEGKASGQLHVPVGYYTGSSDIPALNKILRPGFPNFQTQITDQYRTDLFLRDFSTIEKSGNLPALNLLRLPDDHTSGTNPGTISPAAQVADNDLAIGRVVDAISHSQFWKDTAIFILEDDSQDGVDHVDGHRNPTQVISPYAKRGAVVDNYYSQLNVMRTIEQILGLPPMNQMDMTATPMYDVFTNKPNHQPYTVRQNQIPLTTVNPAPAQLSGAAKAWAQWASVQNYKTEDMVNMAQFNRDIWYSSNNFTVPYPGDSKVLLPNEVPGAAHTPASSNQRTDGDG
jgi:YVTN family beta-propeller protein